MKEYNVFYAGGEKITTIKASCITKACKAFVETLGKKAKYELAGRKYASVRYTDNFSIGSDFVVMEA